MATDRWLVEPVDLTADLDPVCEISRESFASPQTVEMFRREVRAVRCPFRVTGERERYYSDPVDDAMVLWRESLGRLETTLTV